MAEQVILSLSTYDALKEQINDLETANKNLLEQIKEIRNRPVFDLEDSYDENYKNIILTKYAKEDFNRLIAEHPELKFVVQTFDKMYRYRAAVLKAEFEPGKVEHKQADSDA